jgi:UPF0716 family protein affecting phage T7 exclusion
MLIDRIIKSGAFFFILLEFIVFILVIKAIGFWATLFLVFLSTFLGMFFLRLSGVYTLISLQNGFTSIETSDPLKGMAFTVSGFLFLIPGFITSFLAILCLLPVIGQNLANRLASWGRKGRVRTQTTAETSRVIEGEFRREDPP